MAPETTPDVSPQPQPAPAGRGLVVKLVLLGLAVVSAVAGTGLARWLREPAVPPAPPAKLQLDAWPKPDLALFLTGQTHGYLLPCGCSRPQIGGLERRYNVLEMLKAKGWSVLPLDLGDVAQKEGVARLPNLQGAIKYKYAIQALNALRYEAIGFGEYEAALGSINATADFLDTKPKPPFLVGNLDPACDLKQLDLIGNARMLVDPASKVKVGVTAILGADTAARVKDTAMKVVDSSPALTAFTKEMDEKKPDLRVLLFHGSLARGQFKQGKEAEPIELAKAFPQFNYILCLTEEDEPPANPSVVKHANGTETLILSVGHKGKYVGVLGLYRKGAGFTSRWELVRLDEDFLTPKAKAPTHPVVGLLEEYTKELKAQNYLEKAPQVKHVSQLAIPGKNPTFVGEKLVGKKQEHVCKGCHEKAYDVWKASPHSHAYKTLVNAENPSNRQFDPECIVCHTVGYGYESGFRTKDKTPLLINVGCENCHGPCSEHVDNPNNPAWYPIINPYAHDPNETPAQKTKRLGRIDMFCQKCHDIENDVNWGKVGFENKWKKIVHPSFERKE